MTGPPAMDPDTDAWHSLLAYTLGHGDPAFIHQHVVDAYFVQHADRRSKPIGVAFGLAGLYLHVERRFTGRAVQLAHMKLGKDKRGWPAFQLPADRGRMTVTDVMAQPAGAARDQAIHAWSESVWHACAGTREALILMLEEHHII